MRDEPDPPRKYYTFKESEFERVNEVGAASVGPTKPAPTSDQPFKPISQLGNAPANRENEVHAILRENLARDTAAGHYDVPPKPRRRSKRKRDYWILFFTGNAALLTLMWLLTGRGGGAGALITVVSLGAGTIIYNASLGWIMWQVMDDY